MCLAVVQQVRGEREKGQTEERIDLETIQKSHDKRHLTTGTHLLILVF